MIIDDVRIETTNGVTELSARYSWEQTGFEDQRISIIYEADSTFFDAAAIGQAFLIAGVVPALRHGERRIVLKSRGADPWLVDNLKTFIGYLLDWYWYKYDRDPADLWIPEIEVEIATFSKPESPRTGFFYSGGVDSLYTLRRNRLNTPADHPGCARDAIFVHGFDMGTRPQRGSEEEFFRAVIDQMKPVVESEGINIIPVYTNMRLLDNSVDCWLDEYMGAAMSAVAHGLCGRLTDVLIASSYEIPKLHPFACHPVIEPHLSSYGLRVHHDGELLNRVERVRLISQWPEAMRTLRVCFYGDDSGLNCGVCPKCIRTKLELMCAGRLKNAETMPGGELTASEVRKNLIVQHDTLPFMDTLAKELTLVGRSDLASAVSFCRWRYIASESIKPAHWVKYVDEKLLKGRVKRRIVARRNSTV